MCKRKQQGATVVEEHANQRLRDLLREPRETLSVELKGWLDITQNAEHKAILAKAIIALANHGGGHIIIGFDETKDGIREAPGRPENFASYGPDQINAVVARFVEPSFHCEVHHLESPVDGLVYPVVIVPGGHFAPIRSKRDGPNGGTITKNTYYVRRPGPQSAPPENGREWDELIRRCITNAREDLIDRFRILMAGGAVAEAKPEKEEARVQDWLDASKSRWKQLVERLPANHGGRLTHGHFAIAYQLFSEQFEPRTGGELLEAMRQGVIRMTGWPPFWVPTRAGIAPYSYEGNIECWIGGDGDARDPGDADFWRASPQGQFFLIRGYQEDGAKELGRQFGTSFDLTIPTWRMGEVLLHAASMARQFGVPDAQVVLVAEWTGLENRELVAWANRNRMLWDGHRSRQDDYRTSLAVKANSIEDALPEIVDRIVRPLYELFDFFELPRDLVTQELAQMRRR